MNRRMRCIGKRCLASAAMFSIALAGGAHAAAEPSVNGAGSPPDVAPQSAPQMQQLAEIQVRGKRLLTVIVDAEDDFFRLYDQLNHHDDYDIHCGYASLRPGSMIMQRTCMPDFLADAIPAASYPVTDYDAGGVACYGGGGTDLNGSMFYSSPYCLSAPAPVVFVQPPPQLVLMERRKDYTNNMLDVINGNPGLRQKYDHLVGLYHELEATQQQYVRVRNASRPARKPVAGPRAL